MTILTITGPTCSGKTTVEAKLQQMGCGRTISHTTRWPRASEVNGEHYHFVTDDEFDILQAAGKFVENTKFGSCRYALSADSIRTAQHSAAHSVIVADPHGVAQIKDFCLDNGLGIVSIWVDCLPQTQARRWMARLMSDMVVGKDVLGGYTERLGIMLGEEARWRVNTYVPVTQHSAYDLLLSSDLETPDQLAERISRYLATK